MEREHRYIVIKLKDVEAMGNMDAYRVLHNIGRQVQNFRAANGKPPLECVVVESDWPEYEPTWAAIAARMDGTAPEASAWLVEAPEGGYGPRKYAIYRGQHQNNPDTPAFFVDEAARRSYKVTPLYPLATALSPQPQQAAVVPEGLNVPDDLRAEGWAVAVHNDYRLNGEAHTFWLFTKDGRAIKGEGRTDAEALTQCRAEVLRLSKGEK